MLPHSLLRRLATLGIASCNVLQTDHAHIVAALQQLLDKDVEAFSQKGDSGLGNALMEAGSTPIDNGDSHPGADGSAERCQLDMGSPPLDNPAKDKLSLLATAIIASIPVGMLDTNIGVMSSDIGVMSSDITNVQLAFLHDHPDCTDRQIQQLRIDYSLKERGLIIFVPLSVYYMLVVPMGDGVLEVLRTLIEDGKEDPDSDAAGSAQQRQPARLVKMLPGRLYFMKAHMPHAEAVSSAGICAPRARVYVDAGHRDPNSTWLLSGLNYNAANVTNSTPHVADRFEAVHPEGVAAQQLAAAELLAVVPAHRGGPRRRGGQ